MRSRFQNSEFILLASLLGAVALVSCNEKFFGKASAPAPSGSNWIAGELTRAMEAAKAQHSFESFITLGLLQLQNKDPASAERSFQEAIRINPKAPTGYNNLCAADNGMRHWADAIQACKQALALEPGFALAANNLRYSLDSMKKEESQIDALEGRAAKEKGNWDLRVQIGMMYYERADYARAIAHWRRIPRSSPKWAVAQNNIASASILSKDWKTAREAIQQALAAEPSNPLFRNNLKWLDQAETASTTRRPSGSNAD